MDTLRRAVKIHPIQAYQIEYSPFSKDIENPELGLLATRRELGIATVAYSPLGCGILTGQYWSVDDFPEDDFRRTISRFSTQENFDKNLVLVDLLQKRADKKNITCAWMKPRSNKTSLHSGVIPMDMTTFTRPRSACWDERRIEQWSIKPG